MTKKLLFLLLMLPSIAIACGLHQSTGFSLVTLPGSLDVFGAVVEARQHDRFNNQNKPINFQLFTVRSQFAKESKDQLEFVVFEAIRGHASDVNGKSITGKNSDITPQELVVITEWDVLDGIASGSISLSEAIKNNWIRLLGPIEKKQQFSQWVQQWQ